MIATFGEPLLRFAPSQDGGWLRSSTMPVHLGGAELNVARALAKWGNPLRYLTALPENAISSDIQAQLETEKIHLTLLPTTGRRLGTYYLYDRADLGAAAVIYDREHTAFADISAAAINWETTLGGITHLHCSAITPALSQAMADLTLAALQACQRLGITVSMDMNYRAKLWQYGKSPLEVMPQFMPYVYFLMGNVWAYRTMLGIPHPLPDDASDLTQSDLAHAAQLSALALQKRYPHCRDIAFTFRFSQPSLRYFCCAAMGEDFHISPTLTSLQTPEKVGSGDCFMAGMLHGKRQGWSSQATLNFATLAAFNKLFTPGDANTATVAEIQNQAL